MSVSIRQQNSSDTVATTPASYTVTLPGPTMKGNRLIIIVSSDATVTTPSGFTADASVVSSNGHYVFSKLSVDGESSWTVSPTTGAAGAWWVAEISSLYAASPVDKSATNSAASGSNSLSTGTTASTTELNCFVIATWGSSVAAVTSVTGSGQTNSFVEIVDRQTTKLTGTNVGLDVAIKTVNILGTQTSTITWSNTCGATGIVVAYKALPNIALNNYEFASAGNGMSVTEKIR